MLAKQASRKRAVRFSLRTLLLLFTASSIWLGFETKWAADQKRAVDWIVENGGTIEYDSAYEAPMFLKRKPAQSRSKPHWLANFIGIHFYEHPVRVIIKGVTIDDVAVGHLKRLHALRSLRIADTVVEAVALDELHRALPNVHILHANCPVLLIYDFVLSPNQCVVSYIRGYHPGGGRKVLVGDVIVGCSGQSVRNFADLRRILSRYKPDGEITLDVIRNGQQMSYDLPLMTYAESFKPTPAYRWIDNKQ